MAGGTVAILVVGYMIKSQNFAEGIICPDILVLFFESTINLIAHPIFSHITHINSCHVMTKSCLIVYVVNCNCKVYIETSSPIL